MFQVTYLCSERVPDTGSKCISAPHQRSVGGSVRCNELATARGTDAGLIGCLTYSTKPWTRRGRVGHGSSMLHHRDNCRGILNIVCAYEHTVSCACRGVLDVEKQWGNMVSFICRYCLFHPRKVYGCVCYRIASDIISNTHSVLRAWGEQAVKSAVATCICDCMGRIATVQRVALKALRPNKHERWDKVVWGAG